jgi:protein transport protein SEC24
VDFIASNEYMNRPPMPPTYVFVLDVSKPAIDTGYLHTAAATIKSVIEGKLLPGQERARVAFVTYDASVHFYNIGSTRKQAQMLVVTDIENMYLPIPEDLVVDLTDSLDLICAFLDSLPSLFAKSSTVDNCFVAAIQAVGASSSSRSRRPS